MQSGSFYLQDNHSSNGSMVYMQDPLPLSFTHQTRLRMGRSTLTLQARRNWLASMQHAAAKVGPSRSGLGLGLGFGSSKGAAAVSPEQLVALLAAFRAPSNSPKQRSRKSSKGGKGRPPSPTIMLSDSHEGLDPLDPLDTADPLEQTEGAEAEADRDDSGSPDESSLKAGQQGQGQQEGSESSLLAPPAPDPVPSGGLSPRQVAPAFPASSSSIVSPRRGEEVREGSGLEPASASSASSSSASASAPASAPASASDPEAEAAAGTGADREALSTSVPAAAPYSSPPNRKGGPSTPP